jgi:hypothetical protein
MLNVPAARHGAGGLGLRSRNIWVAENATNCEQDAQGLARQSHRELRADQEPSRMQAPARARWAQHRAACAALDDSE